MGVLKDSSDCLYQGYTTTLWPIYDLVDLGNFPTFKFHGNKRIAGELWFVSNRVLKKLDDIEGFPTIYKRDLVKLVNGVDAEVYYLNDKQWKMYKVVNNSNKIVKLVDDTLEYEC